MGKFESQTEAVMAWVQDLKTAGVTELSPLLDETFGLSMEGILAEESVEIKAPAVQNVISLNHERYKRDQRKRASQQLVDSLDGQQLGQACQTLYERQQQWVARLMNAPTYQDQRSQRGLQQILQINTQLFSGAIHAGSLSPWQAEVLLFRKNMLTLQFDLPVEFQRLDGTCWSIMTINRTIYNTLCGMPVSQAGAPDFNTLPEGVSNQEMVLMQQAWSNAYLQQMMGLKQGLDVMLAQEEAAFENAVIALQPVSLPQRSFWHRVGDACRALRG
jgi:hypothetical protein